jgi:hypothetical protein
MTAIDELASVLWCGVVALPREHVHLLGLGAETVAIAAKCWQALHVGLEAKVTRADAAPLTPFEHALALSPVLGVAL